MNQEYLDEYLSLLSQKKLSLQEDNLLPLGLMDPDPPIPGQKEEKGVDFQLISTTYQVTIQRKVSEISKKTFCLLAGNFVRMCCLLGVELKDIFICDFLRFSISKEKDSCNIKDEVVRQVCLALDLILTAEFSFEMKHNIVPDKIVKIISNLKYIPNERTYGSRKISYNLNRYLSVRIVPLERIYEKDGKSIPYSSYCKGYGESGPSTHRKKTKFSDEYDGIPDSREQRFNLSTIGAEIDAFIYLERKKKQVRNKIK